ncbi:MAG: type II 3-dehydroquinate dehydratase [Flammeovirgaceae bacterium]|jgi:3-dehydroquinate dehydratase II|nr:type II 3-dehydroquinate dehydratase [Flammeovirgaceae bacterium]|tara:strand:+ start:8820 stop:9239 length:420 start_codon:yes stop_codon:yes gene_type:complete
MQIAIINGPNLNLLGKRETYIYGKQDFASYFEQLKIQFQEIELSYFQSNSEGDLVSKIQEIGFTIDGIILNPAAYSHTSIAIRDAIAAIKAPVVEVHISNIYAREPFRTHSYISSVAVGVISGLGLKGYELAIESLLTK